MSTELEIGVVELAGVLRDSLMATSIGGTREKLQHQLLALRDEVGKAITLTQSCDDYTYKGWAVADGKP